MAGETAEDAFKAGVTLAGGLFLLVYLVLIQRADTTTEAIDIFGRTFYAFVMAFFPTSKIAVLVDLVVGTLGASIAASKLRAKGVGILIAFGFCWTVTNLIIGWLSSPI